MNGFCGGEEIKKRCSMDVYSVPWQQKTEIQWDNVNCEDQGEELTTKASRIHLSAPLLNDLPGARVGIVDLSGQDTEASDISLLGGDDHDKAPHGHGPQFSEEYTVKELKAEKKSWEELKVLQSLGSFHDFMAAYNKTYSSRKEYKLRYGVFKDNMKKVQFLRESEQVTYIDLSYKPSS